jgi:predicted tellurium resistance membrane protein TerC
METLFTAENLISLLTLTVLEVVLGVDNVIFVSIVMGRLRQDQQQRARTLWMITGITVRILLLIGLGWLIRNGYTELFEMFGKSFNLRSLIMLAGGFFLLYKSVKEIHEKLEGEEVDASGIKKVPSKFGRVLAQIILVDMVFSFDSIITAIGMARRIEVMMTAVIIAMMLMFFFSRHIANFINKHPTLKMLALSFLVMIGVVLIIEGWDSVRAHEIRLKNYVYFSMAFAFLLELLNMYVRKRHTLPVKLRQPTTDEEIINPADPLK